MEEICFKLRATCEQYKADNEFITNLLQINERVVEFLEEEVEKKDDVIAELTMEIDVLKRGNIGGL